MTTLVNGDGGGDLDSASYDPVQHLNAIFSHPSILISAPRVSAALSTYQDELDTHITDAAERQAASDADSLQRMQAAQADLAELFARVDSVQQRAVATEQTITDMTAEIKRLDNTKRNLTLSMTELKRMQMLTTAYEQLRASADTRQYGDCAELLKAVIELMAHFSTYRSIDQIAALSRNVADLQHDLLEQVREDFETGFSGSAIPAGNNRSSISGAPATPDKAMLTQACLVTDAIGEDARTRLINWYCNTQLREYRQLFKGSEEAGSLDNIGMRYSWYKRLLKVYDTEHAAVFPPAWRVGEVLTRMFCEGTCDDFRGILARSRATLNVDLLLRCLQETMEFETWLESRFNGAPAGGSTASSSRLSTDTDRSERTAFGGHPISQAFEPYLDLWIEAQERELAGKIRRFRTSPLQAADEEFNSSLVAPSSIELIIFYQRTFKSCATLSPGTNLADLARVFGEYFDQYAQQVLYMHLSERPSGATPSHRASLEEISLIINTADYCYKETEKLELAIKDKIRSDLRGQVDLSTQADTFLGITTAAVHALVRRVEVALEPAWREMRNVGWARMATVSDQSRYVGELARLMREQVEAMRSVISKQSALGVFYNTLQAALCNAYIANIFQCKPVSEVGAEQMLLDTYILRQALESLNPSSNVYTSRVGQSASRISLLLKTMQVRPSPPEALVQAYLIHIADRSDVNFRKLLELKGVSRNKAEAAHLMDLFKAHRAGPKMEGLQDSSPLFAVGALGGSLTPSMISGPFVPSTGGSATTAATSGPLGLGSSLLASATAAAGGGASSAAGAATALTSSALASMSQPNLLLSSATGHGGSGPTPPTMHPTTTSPSSPPVRQHTSPVAGTSLHLPSFMTSSSSSSSQQGYAQGQESVQGGSRSMTPLSGIAFGPPLSVPQGSSNTTTTSAASNLNENLRNLGRLFKRDSIAGIGGRFGGGGSNPNSNG